MQNEPDFDKSPSEVDPQDLESLMRRISSDAEAQDTLLKAHPSAATRAAELLTLLKEAKRRFEIIAYPDRLSSGV